LVKTYTGKTSSLLPVGCVSDQFPTRGTPTTSLHLAQKSLPHTKSLRLAREVSASHDKIGSDWRMGPDAQRKLTTRAPPSTRVEEQSPMPCK
jgi:hypothetical protein